MAVLRPILVVCGVILAIAVGVVTFGNTGHANDDAPQMATPVDSSLAAKAQDHCWFSVKSRSIVVKSATGGRAFTATSAGAKRLGDLILVTGTIEPAAGDARFYGCALYEYTEGSPVVVSTRTSSAPPPTSVLIPAGFSQNGRRL